ncbi:MAG: efflux RND transporter periplasmic adaptor subunit [Chloroflexota bacterium]|nr:efflux RND transporter periplasmic adaptor subunit [Chloroflexota bacterium]
MRRVAVILIVLLLIIGGSVAAYQITAQEKEPPPPDYDVLQVGKGDIISTVSATGAMEPKDEVTLTFKGLGRVAEVLVEEGGEVVANQILARLETDDLDLALAQAEVGLAISQAQLEKLKAGPNEVDVLAAEANLESARAARQSAVAAAASARAAYNDLVAGPTEDEKRTAAANRERARIMRDQAQTAYDQVAHMPNVGLLPQSAQLQQATVDLEIAEASYRLSTAEPKQSQIAAAQAQIAQADAAISQAEAAVATAESNLQRLLEGPSDEDLTVAEAQVTQAQLAVQQARLAGDGGELTSPIAGVISQINIKRGELPNPALPAAIVTDIDRFHIDVNVDEIDIARLSIGQPVEVSLDALPEAELTGHIDFIAPTPLSLGGVVSYPVRVVIDETDTPLRSGLSATATIITEELNDMLVIPNRAIEIDRSTGRAYVDVIVNGVPTRTEIILGSRNASQSQVVSGLEEGDELAIGAGSGLDRLRSTFFGQ